MESAMSMPPLRSVKPWSVHQLMAGLAFLLLAALSFTVHAQIAFRAAATGTAVAPTLRAFATSAITYRGSATTTAGATPLVPVFRAATAASAGSGVLTLTITKPAGTIENDVMVAAIGVSANAPVITPPAGWVLVRKMDNGAANANSLAVYYKVATATEPANYAWGLSASTGAAGGIQTFYNVDITFPIDGENGQTTASATSHIAPGITTTVANTMLVTAYTFSSSRGWNNPPLAPAVPAVTERVDVRSNGNNNAGQSTAAHQGVVAAAGAVPALTASTAVAGGSADVGNAHMLALRPALRVPRLATTVSGDFMVAAIGVQPSTATVTPPAGWTLVRRVDNAGPTSNSLVIYRKFAAPAEPASYLWLLSGATAAVAGIQSFSGVDVAAPVDAENGQATASALLHTAPIIATTVANALLVGHYTFASARPWTAQNPPGPPVAMTESYDVASQAAGAAGQSLEGTRLVQAVAGASAAYASQASADADAGATHIMALRPSLASVSIGLPAGTIATDVMVASIGIAWSGAVAPVVTPPAGWTLVRQVDNNNPTPNSLVVLRKTAAVGEPTIYEFGVTNAAYVVGGIQTFYNVDNTTPVDVENGQITASATTHGTPIVNTTVNNTALVTSHTYASSRTWTPPVASGGDLVMNEAFDRPSGPNSATGQSIEGNWVVKQLAGATMAKVATAAGNADVGATHILALRSPSPMLTINKPAGTVANDVMIASIGVSWRGALAPVATPPAGWTLVRQIDNNTATRNSLFIYRKTDGGAEPASYTWNFTNFIFASGGIQSFSGVNTITPINVENGVATASALTHATPSVVTTVANTMLVTSHTYASSGIWAPPGGMAEGFDVSAATWAVPNATGQSTEGSYVLQAVAGATGTKTATATLNADRGNAHILALRPGAAVVAPSTFNGCESATCVPVAAPLTYAALFTKRAGTAFTLHGVALKVDGTLEPGFSGNVAVDLLANTNTGVALDGNGCPTSQTATIALGNAAFASGRASIAGINVASAYRDVRMRFSCAAGVCGSAITRCSSDNFAVRPDSFTSVVGGAPLNLNNVGTSGAPSAIAGADTFTLIAATGVVGYTGTPKVDNSALQAHAGAIQNGTVSGVFPAALTASGTSTGTSAFTYSEVGNFRFLGSAATAGSTTARGVYDDDFTSVDATGDCTADFSNVLAGGKYGCTFGIVADTAYFGRFYPKDFLLTVGTLTNRRVASCAPASTFTYAGEQFRVTFSLTARNGAGTPATTQNYDPTAGFAALDAATIANFGFGAVDLADATPPLAATALTSSLTLGSSSGTWDSGEVPVTADLMLTRASQVGPFESFNLGIDPADADGVKLSAYDLDTSVPADTADRGLVGISKIRFGRLATRNVLGSELLDIRIPVRAEYFNGASWTLNADDGCTVVPSSSIALGNYLAPPAGTAVSATNMGVAPTDHRPGSNLTLTGGSGTIVLAKPSPVATGAFDVVLNLGTGIVSPNSCATGVFGGGTAASLGYLLGKWCGSNFDRAPSVRVKLGSPKAPYIYLRERY